MQDLKWRVYQRTYKEGAKSDSWLPTETYDTKREASRRAVNRAAKHTAIMRVGRDYFIQVEV